MFDVISEIWITVSRNKLRTALTGFAVAWGIFILILLLGAGKGVINGMNYSSKNFVPNSIMIGGGTTSKPYNGMNSNRDITLNQKDLQITKNSFAQVVDTVVGRTSQFNSNVSKGDMFFEASIVGVEPEEEKISKIEMLAGRFINKLDGKEKRKVIVISEKDVKEIWKGNPKALVGEYVLANGIAFRVVGVYKTDQTSFNQDSYLPYETVKAMYHLGHDLGNITFTFHGINSQKDNDEFEKAYRPRINANHMAAPDDDTAFWIWNRLTQAIQMNEGSKIINIGLWVIGILTLLSGIVGISNIMLITVKERTREFGIRKAIGASPNSILRLILLESIMITTFFGYVGMFLGVCTNLYMDATIGQEVMDLGVAQVRVFVNPVIGMKVCIYATLMMIVAGTFAGLVPARKAARIRPIEALRAE